MADKVINQIIRNLNKWDKLRKNYCPGQLSLFINDKRKGELSKGGKVF